MEMPDVINQINEIFKEVLDNDNLLITASTTASNIEEWDSLSHIELVVAIEKHFKVRFTSGEIQSFKNVGEMCDSIIKKLHK